MATLIEILARSGNLQNAEKTARFLSDDNPKYLLDLQLILSVQGKFEEAWEVNNKATKIFPNDYRVAFNRGWLMMYRGHIQKGFELLELGRFAGIWGDPPLLSNKPIWKGDNIKNKTLLLYCEGGLGDEIICTKFVSSLNKLNMKVIIACNVSLMNLFAGIKGVSAVVDKRMALSIFHDFWIPSMSLAKVLNITYETLPNKPHLTAIPKYVEKWKNKLFKKSTNTLNIGIRWAGNPQFEHDQHRTIPAHEFITVLNSLNNVKLFSLQRDNNLIYLPDNIIDLSPHLKTWDDTAAICSCLDLIITSDTSIAHLSASLGKPTWILIPVMPYYTWALPGKTTPWYESVRLFRQNIFNQWTDTINDIVTAINITKHKRI